MDEQPTFSFLSPPSLSDEAAYEIFEFLEALSLAFAERYFGQIRRHRRAIHLKRNPLIDSSWEEDEGRSS
jgi:hypothetical protein